jgi:Protein of unknown function (DUF3800)
MTNNPTPIKAKTTPQFAFIDEVGLSAGDKMQPFMALGLLKIQDTSQIHSRLYKLHYSYSAHNLTERKKLINSLTQDPKALKFHELNSLFLLNRHHEFKYDSLGFPNLHKYKEVVDIVLDHPIEFDCIVVDKSGEDFDLEKYGTYWHAYCKYLQILITENKDNNNVIPILDFLHKPNDQLEIVEILNKLDNVVNAIQADSKCHILLQISDLFLGAVVFELKHKMGLFPIESNKVKARIEFGNYLCDKLGVNDLSDNFIKSQNGYKILSSANKKIRDNTHSARPD